MIQHPRRRARFHHFRRRVRERIGSHVDADVLWETLITEIGKSEVGHRTPYLKFICRVNREGLRLWRFEIEGARNFVLYDHAMKCPVTIFPPKGKVPRIGKSPINLEIYS